MTIREMLERLTETPKNLPNTKRIWQHYYKGELLSDFFSDMNEQRNALEIFTKLNNYEDATD